ncbi:MAG: hypothetical protein OXI22_18780 [Defluviicoccus sp.]|nr:hypothetical protein [Defluviicoccus sp.]MDE0385934.1 hypothetical protein [Defluviicoccus sp.]
MALSPDDLPSDITESLRDALIAYHEEHGTLPPQGRWDIIFGTDAASPAENRWMLM